MHRAVRDIFPSFSEKFEGRIPHMYLDIKGLVTVGIGNLIDPISAALPLPFTHKGRPGDTATEAEIRAEWERVKAHKDLAQKGAHSAAKVTALELSAAAIDALVQRHLLGNEGALKRAFPDLDRWPADAQLALFSMAWAMGPSFTAEWPRFVAACRAHDWRAAAGDCHMDDTDNSGLKPRNEANVLLLKNAEAVKAKGLDPAKLIWPGRVE